MLNVEEHRRRVDESQVRSGQIAPVKHRRDSPTSNLRQSPDSQPEGSPTRLKRAERRQRLRPRKMHANQGPMESRKPRVEKSGRTRNELSSIEQKVQGNLHSQYPLAVVEKHKSLEKGRLDQRPRTTGWPSSRMDLLLPRSHRGPR
ncbi:unnamed protein product [Sphagnum troendelagicum]|uniref:Uncharacterized protein n=1 Tax=Sphagnum troendelagicum TaxID=128251 RepID=A0ABP0U4W0_9BRYO